MGKDPSEWAANAQGGMQMTFAMLLHAKGIEFGKTGTDRLASQWKSMLETGGVNANCYAVDPGQILFTTNGPGLVGKVKEFVLSQPDVDWFEYQQKRSYPEGRNEPVTDHEERKKRDVELGLRQPDPPKAPDKKKEAVKKKDSKKRRRRKGAAKEL